MKEKDLKESKPPANRLSSDKSSVASFDNTEGELLEIVCKAIGFKF